MNLKQLIKEVERLNKFVKLDDPMANLQRERLYGIKQTVEAVDKFKMFGSPDWQKLKDLLGLK